MFSVLLTSKQCIYLIFAVSNLYNNYYSFENHIVIYLKTVSQFKFFMALKLNLSPSVAGDSER